MENHQHITQKFYQIQNIPTATFVKPGRSTRVKLTTAKWRKTRISVKNIYYNMGNRMISTIYSNFMPCNVTQYETSRANETNLLSIFLSLLILFFFSSFPLINAPCTWDPIRKKPLNDFFKRISNLQREAKWWDFTIQTTAKQPYSSDKNMHSMFSSQATIAETSCFTCKRSNLYALVHFASAFWIIRGRS